jgi:methyl-coenzyme M reductase beta subunit
MFSPEMTSGMVGNIYSDIEYFKEPLKYVADGAREIKEEI